MRTASWVLLAVVGALTLIGGLVSAGLAYRGDYPIGPAAVGEVAAGRAPVETALRGIRGTSAAYGVGYAVLFLSIVLGPYRRGELWSWWALLAATLVLTAIVVLRVPLLGTRLGTGAALIQAGVALVGLLLDVRRLSPKR